MSTFDVAALIVAVWLAGVWLAAIVFVVKSAVFAYRFFTRTQRRNPDDRR